MAVGKDTCDACETTVAACGVGGLAGRNASEDVIIVERFVTLADGT